MARRTRRSRRGKRRNPFSYLANRRRSRKAARRTARRSRRSRRNARGWYDRKGKGSQTGAFRASSGRFSGRSGRRLYSRPSFPNPRRRRSRRRSRRNPFGLSLSGGNGGGRPLFGIKLLNRIPLIGPLFREDLAFTGVGVAVGVGLIPKLEGQVLQQTGLANQAWYATPQADGSPSIGHTAVDVGLPMAIGAVGLMAATAVRQSAVKAIAKGWAIAGIGLGIGRVLARFIYPSLPANVQPTALPGPGAADYLRAPAQLGMQDYLRAPAGMSDASGRLLSAGGDETDLINASAEMRQW